MPDTPSLTPFDAEAVADEIGRAREAAGRLAPFSDRVAGFGLEEAYRAAGILACRRAARSPVVGRKIGFTNRSLWEDAGLAEPVWGSMFEETVRRGAGAGPVRLPLAGAVEPKIECEVVVVLASPPEPGERDAAVARRVSLVGLGFEVVDSPYPGWKMRPEDTVAAGGLHHGLAVGELRPIGDPETASAALAGLRVAMERNGEPAPDGVGSLVMGNPLNAVGVLAEICAKQGNPLERGEIITTGTLTPPLDCRVGERYAAEAVDSVLPPVSVELTAT